MQQPGDELVEKQYMIFSSGRAFAAFVVLVDVSFLTVVALSDFGAALVAPIIIVLAIATVIVPFRIEARARRKGRVNIGGGPRIDSAARGT
jgi:hypothetical protein